MQKSKLLAIKKVFLLLSSALVLIIIATVAFAAEETPLKLSLDDAILLAIRANPTVKTTRLNYTLQKFNTYVQQWQFYPHYSFLANAGAGRSKSAGQFFAPTSNFNAQPAITLTTPIGTQLTLSATNAKGENYNPGVTLQVLQPLLRGFGRAVVEAQLRNAQDSEVVARLNLEGTLRATVTEVINAYLGVVTAEKSVSIDEKALSRARESVQQTKIFIKSGRKAGNELVTVLANVASAQSQLENDKNDLVQSRYALLAAIGIDPNAKVTFDTLNVDRLIRKYRLPQLADVKRLILENDVSYQTSLIMLHGQTKRGVLTAEDNARWRLDFTANLGAGNGAGGGFNAGTNSLLNGANWSQEVGLTLQIPINDQLSKQAVMSAKIALQQAELALTKDKWSKETSAINAFNLVQSAKRSFKFAEDAERLQERTYHVSYQKYLHGLIDSLELQTAQESLIRAQQTLLSARINYLKSLVNLDMLMGNTLNTWDIGVRV